MRALIARAVAGLRQRRHEARLWRDTTGLADLGELTARWLTGELATVPGYFGTPAEETMPIAGALAAFNRAGFVTENSQPGLLPDADGTGRVWRQRAFVIGFVADAAAAERLTALRKLGLGVVLIGPGERGRSHVPVTEYAVAGGWAGNCVTAVGAEMSPRDLHAMYDGVVGPQAATALRQAWQVTVYDPEWGRNDRLWTALVEILDAPPATIGRRTAR